MKKASIILASFWLFFNPLPASAYYGRPGWGGWHMMDFGYGGAIMWIILLVILAVAVYLILQASKSRSSQTSPGESPLEILKKRYAGGEINKEEFDRMKKDLES